MASFFCSAIVMPGRGGQVELLTDATHPPRNSRGAGGGVSAVDVAGCVVCANAAPAKRSTAANENVRFFIEPFGLNPPPSLSHVRGGEGRGEGQGALAIERPLSTQVDCPSPLPSPRRTEERE